jgi:transcriptional regulator with XRE-family HTH domain
MQTLGQYLREKREARGITVRALATRCRGLAPSLKGLHHSSLTFWETGYRARRPSAAQLDVLCDALGLTVEERLHALRLARESSSSSEAGRISVGAA